MLIVLFIISLLSVNGFTRRNRLPSTKLYDLNNKLVDVNTEDFSFLKNKNYFDIETIPELIDDINDQKISKIYISNDYKELISLDKIDDKKQNSDYTDYHLIKINPIVTQKIIEKSIDKKIDAVFIQQPISSFSSSANQFALETVNFLSNIFFPIMIIVFLSNIFSNVSRMNGGGQFGNNFRDLKKDKELVQKSNITLSSWSGSPEIFEECTEIVSYIKNDTLYKNVGAEIPKGILLEGPPGTGKTLLAKAIASECNANFISIAGSEFVELFVGMGASRVRNLFKQARENKPCIIFIDEIDAVGRQRGAGVNMANDEREQTLNQLLAEMDGFSQNDGIIILAATNRKDVLDKALLRPGRFDRLIKVPLPDKDSRKKILSLYLENKKIEQNINMDDLAEITGGYSGADLKNIINEAAIIAARNGKNYISGSNLYESLEKSIVGIIKKNDSRSSDTIERVSIHETGHALLVILFENYFNLQKISVQSTYNGAGGYTIFSEKPEYIEGGLYTKDLLKKRLIITLGGKAAENIFYGDDHVSLGATQDLKQANNLAQRMISNYGMGDKLEVFYNDNVEYEGNPFLGRSLAMGDKYSESRKFEIDKESLQLVIDAYNEAKILLTNNKEKMLKIIDLLNNKKIIYYSELKDLL